MLLPTDDLFFPPQTFNWLASRDILEKRFDNVQSV